jgi:hypothetical protein
VNGTVEVAGPEAIRLDELARWVLAASKDPRPVTADVHARYFGAQLDDRSLTPGDDAHRPDLLRGLARGSLGMSPRLLLLLWVHRARMRKRDWRDAEIAAARLPLGRPQARLTQPSINPRPQPERSFS